ncbi:thiamine pyrophosphate-dependent enzyme [Halanaerobacter jeridensis]|uniref:2-oxoglutarate ferredoxin oxidoreductase subunit beta n=1 Tax=Halanaerobacter jeridensis TaxID=706427 RepID=A0A938XSD6_9FIRM|nr:thiamine pyrophosphate-dependent enzyme [Halanaerobacter jeridensis]MBM7556608.1 2-oxoglutarate ferredoxin oxidoreductase subunit beta [Halanaerobacter jeridensis]
MVDKAMYEGNRETAWCPGCGNFPLRQVLVDALADLDLKPSQVAMFTGIGQAPKMPHYMKVNGFNGLHGRALPPALGMRVANKDMKVIVETGDGNAYGEGGNHLLHNIRRNPDLAHFVHDNQIYGLTKGQASPTTGEEIETAVQPNGITAQPLNPIKLAVSMEASFVARGFVGNRDHLKMLMQEALKHRGYALIDILQPCVSFNKVNTYQWYAKRVYEIGEEYDPTNYDAAMKKAEEWGDDIPLGIIYKNEDKAIFHDKLPQVDDKPLVEKESTPQDKEYLLKEFK